MKKLKQYINEKGVLFASWFGVTNGWGSDAFTTIDGTIGKVTEIINTAIFLSALVAVGLIVYGAYNMISSAGDAEKYEAGTKAIQNALIGMVIVFLAGMIIKFVVTEILK